MQQFNDILVQKLCKVKKKHQKEEYILNNKKKQFIVLLQIEYF